MLHNALCLLRISNFLSFTHSCFAKEVSSFGLSSKDKIHDSVIL